MAVNFVDVTEIEGQRVSAEQLARTCHRYYWAAESATNRDVLEVACGSGPGLGLLKAVAKSVVAGDLSEAVLSSAKHTYGNALDLHLFDAETLPFSDLSFDILLMFEALYYVPRIDQFFVEAKRVLKPGGQLMIVTANKDLYDFTPSPYSTRYLGVVELTDELRAAGFSPEFFGHLDTRTVSHRQRLLRPFKLMASKLGLVPKTMHGKERLKKLFFGEMAVMPSDISKLNFTYQAAPKINAGQVDSVHKVIYCCATANGTE
jgi:ubiquinone/menaquinone biosynthesis C-methylase UbiE